MPASALLPTASWWWSDAFFPPRPTHHRCGSPTSNFAYPACHTVRNPVALPIRTERHNPHSIATLRRQIATHLARSLPRCPCCLRQRRATACAARRDRPSGGQRLPRSRPADGHQRGNDGGAEAVLGMVLLGDP